MANSSDAAVKLYEIFLAGEAAAVHRLIDEYAMAPSTADRIAVTRLIASECAHFEELAEKVREAGHAVDAAVDRHVQVFEKYHQVTTPSTWLEVLVKMYIGDGLAADFFAEVAGVLPEGSREIFASVMGQTTSSDWARDAVRAAVAADPAVAAPLALWGRRLLGEAITHMQWVLAEDEEVTDFLFAGAGSLTSVAGFFDSMAQRHAARMADLSLA
ncbi:ferritin-like fold-containing protein [Gordonia sp. VNK21]|uniref:ferritin-like fold-containing protein n=1 Tax=Gordonia sp. VNK21 TaxID=3382483 RepID=UPI0038D4F363